MKLAKQQLTSRQCCFWFLVAGASAPSTSWAQNPPLIAWPNAPTLAGADEEQTRADFAADGKRAAFLIGGRLWVHQTAATGALGAQLYVSPPAQKVASFVWAGQKLFVSRQLGARAETVSLTLAPKLIETPMFPFAAASLRLAPGGGRLALVPLESAAKSDTQIEFFHREGTEWVRTGGYLRAGAGALEQFWKDSNFGRPQWLYLLDWNDDGRGVFAVLPAVSSDKANTPPAREQQLCLVLSEGEVLPLSRPGSIGPYFRPNMLPMAGLVKREGVRAVPVGREFISEFGPLAAPRHYLMGVQPTAWQDEYKRGKGKTVAYLPDTRYALQQMETATGKWELIVSDLDEGRWKSLGQTSQILTAHGWSGDHLLVRTRSNAGVAQWGILRLAADFGKQENGWAKAETSRDKPNAVEQKVLDFFKTPNLATYAPLLPFYDDFRSQTEAGRPQGFSFWGYNYGPYIRIDPKLDRMVSFDGPNAVAPLPNTPITPEKARQSALDFMGAVFPDWVRVAPQITVTLMGLDLNYRVRFDLAAPLSPGAPPLCVVSVRANDGRVNGYSEAQEQISKDWPSWQRAASQEIILPFDTLRPSPDGNFLLFRWNTPRAGYPAWWKKRPLGLYLLDLHAKEAKPRFIDMNTGMPWWSPDSRRFAFARDGFQIYDVKTEKTQKVPMPAVQNGIQRLLGWKSADDVLLQSLRMPRRLRRG